MKLPNYPKPRIPTDETRTMYAALKDVLGGRHEAISRYRRIMYARCALQLEILAAERENGIAALVHDLFNDRLPPLAALTPSLEQERQLLATITSIQEQLERVVQGLREGWTDQYLTNHCGAALRHMMRAARQHPEWELLPLITDLLAAYPHRADLISTILDPKEQA